MNHVVRVAAACHDRIDSLALTGERADNEAMAFFCGAAHGLAMAGAHQASATVMQYATFIVSIQGAAEVAQTPRLPRKRRVVQ